MKPGFELPEWIDQQTWSDFEDMRQKIRKPLTDAARRLAIKRLLEIWKQFGHPPTAVLEQSILNAWQGVWPLSMSKFERKQEEIRSELNIGAGPITNSMRRERKLM